MFCTKCGSEIKQGAKYCHKCGQALVLNKRKNILRNILLNMFFVFLGMSVLIIYNHLSSVNLIEKMKKDRTEYKNILPVIEYDRIAEDISNAGVMTDEEIISIVCKAAKFAYDWFWISDRDHVDEHDTYVEYDEYGNPWKYKKVNYENITCVNDVLELTKQYFTENVATDLLSQKTWYEQSGKVYVSEPDGLGGPEADYCDIEIVKDNNKRYLLVIYEYFSDELWEDPYFVHLEYINGYWVLDRELFWTKEEIPINIVDSVEEVDKPESILAIEPELYYGKWSNYEENKSDSELLEVTFESYEEIADVSAIIGAKEYATGQCFFEDDGSFSCCFIIDSMYDDQTGQWEPAYAKAYLNGSMKNVNCIECALQYEGGNKDISYRLYKVD